MARILIIDDDPDVRQVCRALLEEEGHEVVEASDGNIGLKQYREAPADVVITDIVMPEKEGLETIIELKRSFPDAKIIAVSGGGETLLGSTCLHLASGLGAQRVMSKPIDFEELFEAVRELVGSQEPSK